MVVLHTYRFRSILACLQVLLVLMVCSPETEAQSISDSLFSIPGVVISASRNDHFSNDTRSEDFDSSDLSDFRGESIARFLSAKTALNLKNYGAGGAASTVSLRGTSSSHLQVNWNGFPVNSVTLGSCDFSMLPAGGFDNISVIHGASGSLYGSGTFGGAVNLVNQTEPGKALNGEVTIGYQSLNALSGSLAFHAGTERMAWKMHSWGTLSENKFRYFDYIRQEERVQTDGGWKDAGMIQSLAFSINSTSSIETGIWYQVKSYSIPSRIGSTSYETQKDSTLRLYAAYKTSGNRWSLKFKNALFSSRQAYRQKTDPADDQYSVISDISSLQLFSDVNFRYYIRKQFSIDAGLTGTFTSASVSSYGGEKEEKGLAAFTGIKYSSGGITLLASLREEWSNTYNSGLLPSAGLSWNVVPGTVEIKANISRKFRKPTFNDLFWQPGGNPGLKPESGTSVDAGTELLLSENEHHSLKAETGFYYSVISNMIAWVPSGTFWAPQNHQVVNTKGADAGLIYDGSTGSLKYGSKINLMFNRAVSSADGEDTVEKILYSPFLTAFWELSLSYGLFDFSVRNHFASGRLYDRTHTLDPYYTADIQAGLQVPAGNGKAGISLIAYNVTGATYELIRLYPMPGPWLSLKLSYKFF